MTWTDFDAAVAAYGRHQRAGIGLALTKDDPFYFVDVDDCRDPQSGEIKPWAQPIVRSFRHTYQEFSPTATGIKIIGQGVRPGDKSVKSLNESSRAKIEIYDGGGAKYTTMTGHRCPWAAAVVTDAQAALDTLYADLFPGEAPTATGRTAARASRRRREGTDGMTNGIEGRLARLEPVCRRPCATCAAWPPVVCGDRPGAAEDAARPGAPPGVCPECVAHRPVVVGVGYDDF